MLRSILQFHFLDEMSLAEHLHFLLSSTLLTIEAAMEPQEALSPMLG